MPGGRDVSSSSPTGWKPIVWLIGTVVCLLNAPYVQCPQVRAVGGQVTSIQLWQQKIKATWLASKLVYVTYKAAKW